MQNKGAIRFFAIALALVCLYQLSFTFFTKKVESDAREYAQGDPKLEQEYLDSMSTETVYNFIWLKKYTYRECQEKEINLGLDLKGGMNVTLEISVVDVIRNLSSKPNDSLLNKIIVRAQKLQENSQEDFITLFGKAFQELAPDADMAAFFDKKEYSDRIKRTSTDEEVLAVIRMEADGAIANTYNILRNRIDRFGVTQPNIQQLETSGRILVELPGIKEPERVRKLLQGTASLEFWATYHLNEIINPLISVNEKLKLIEKGNSTINDSLAGDSSLVASLANDSLVNKDTNVVVEDTTSLVNQMKTDSNATDSMSQDQADRGPLFNLVLGIPGDEEERSKSAAIGITHFKDTAKVNAYLNLPEVKSLLPREAKFLWSYKAAKYAPDYYELIAIKMPADGKAPLTGNAVTDARMEYGNNSATAEVSMVMNSEGSREWARITRENVGYQVAIVLDNYVYSYPTVQQEIKGGRSSITGDFSIEEATDLANVLKSGELPAPARIIEEAIVGPSLGQESINSGLISFLLAFVLVLLYMYLYYNKAGLVANIALVTNVFLLVGVLASLGAVLTLPGIAGMVLTMGMAVDANVIIYERIREELRAGKGVKLAVSDGYKNAYSAIIDGNVTTILTGIILFVFGSGPIQGFATTLIIGILTSLFTAIFISRLIFERMLNKNGDVKFDNSVTRKWFTNVNINFIGMRKKLYVVSAIVLTAGIVSLATKGLNFSVDFTGGRTFVVRFDKDVEVGAVRDKLASFLGEAPEVKTFGAENQVRITTQYLIDQNTPETDSIISVQLYNGLKDEYSTPITFEQFSSSDKTVGILSSQKVGPTIADDIKYAAVFSVIAALLAIFIYIAIRFRQWQWGLGGVVSLFHDTLFVIGFYSIFEGILPFNLEVDQAFIAAILTIIGYSINDTVIIFDRIREYRTLHPRWEMKDSVNGAINSTLGRTTNTSLTTLVVLLAIFIFGGEVIRGFTFALLIGIAVGTYSSIFNATPVAYDLIRMRKNKKKKE